MLIENDDTYMFGSTWNHHVENTIHLAYLLQHIVAFISTIHT